MPPRMLRSWSLRIALFALLLWVLGPLLAFTGILPGFQGMLVFASAALVGLVAIVAGILSAVMGRVAPGLTAVALGFLALFAVLTPAFAGGGKPAINDITTELEGVAESRIFRLRDDFVVRVRPEEGGGTRVDMRSKSRVGRGDLGANAERIHEFLQALAGAGH